MATNELTIILKAKDLASKSIKSVTTETKNLNTASRQTSKGLNALGSAFGGLSLALGAATGIGLLAAALYPLSKAFEGLQWATSGAIDNFNKFEHNLAGIRKTTEASKEEAKAMSMELAKLDTITSISTRQEMARLAGQIGIAKEDIVAFVKEVDMASVALGDEFSGGAEEVVTQMGKLKNVFRDTKNMLDSEAIRRLGSAINELGKAGTATGGNITEFGLRIAGAIPQMDSKTALAFGAALEELGTNAEIATGGLSNLFAVASRDTNAWAKQLGMSQKEMAKLITTDPVGFFEKLSDKTKSMTEVEVAEWLHKMKIGTQESVRVANNLKNNMGLLRKAVDVSNKGFEGGTSLANEFAIAMDSNISNSQRLTNAFEFMQIKIGDAWNQLVELLGGRNLLIGVVKELDKFVDGFVKGFTQNFPVIQKEINNLKVTFNEFLEVFGLVNKESASMNIGEAIGGGSANIIADLISKVREFVQYLIENKDSIIKTFNDINTSIAFIGTQVNDPSSGFNQLRNIMSQITTVLGPLFLAWIYSVSGALNLLATTIKAGQMHTNALKKAFESSPGANFVNQLISDIKRLIKPIEEAINKINALKNALRGVDSKAIASKASQSAGSGISNVIASIKGGHNGGKIKEFARGGFVDGLRMGNGKDNLLVRAEQDEVILNRRQQNNLNNQLNNGGGFTVNGNITVVANNPEQFMEQINQYFAKQNSNARNGFNFNAF